MQKGNGEVAGTTTGMQTESALSEYKDPKETQSGSDMPEVKDSINHFLYFAITTFIFTRLSF